MVARPEAELVGDQQVVTRVSDPGQVVVLVGGSKRRKRPTEGSAL